MKNLLILCSSFLMVACATGYNPRYYYNEIQVVNLAEATIADVNVRILATPKVLSCDEVRKNAMCHDRFGKRGYPQQGLELSWTHPDGSSKSEMLTPSIPATFFSAFPLRIVMEIREDGSVKPFFEQEEPGRGGGSVLDI